MEKEKFTASKFADEIGVNRSSLHHILTERNGPSYEFVVKTLNRFPKINPDWLLHGTGEMFRQEYLQEINKEKNITKNTKVKEAVLEYPTNENSVNPLIKNSINQQIVSEFAHKSADNKQLEKIMIFFTDKSYVEYKIAP